MDVLLTMVNPKFSAKPQKAVLRWTGMLFMLV